MAGAEVMKLTSVSPGQRTAAHEAVVAAFLWAFRLVLVSAAALAVIAAIAGALFPGPGRVSPHP